MDILKRIEELRKEKGWTMYRLAKESMIQQSTLPICTPEIHDPH